MAARGHPALIRTIRDGVSLIEQDGPHLTMMTVIPPKQGAPDRLAALLQQAFRHDTRVSPSLIRLVKPVEKQSRLDRTARRANVEGAYVSPGGSLASHTILVVDDVVTTGATLSQAAHQLEQRGASVVRLALGIDQHLVTDDTLQLSCTRGQCDGHMTLKLNSSTFKPFWGCTNGRQGCRETLDYVSGL